METAGLTVETRVDILRPICGVLSFRKQEDVGIG